MSIGRIRAVEMPDGIRKVKEFSFSYSHPYCSTAANEVGNRLVLLLQSSLMEFSREQRVQLQTEKGQPRSELFRVAQQLSFLCQRETVAPPRRSDFSLNV
jgi:hypothetical protein